MTTWKTTPTKTIDVDGTSFAYRELGKPGGVPVVFLHHLTAVLDDWDPRVLDGVAAQHHVIAFDNRGVGATGGRVPTDIEQMGADAIAFIRALGLRAGRPDRLLARRRRRPDGRAPGTRPRPPDGARRHRPARWRRHLEDAVHRRRRLHQGVPDPEGPAPLPVLPAHHRGQEGGQRLLRAARGAHDGSRQADLLAGPHRPARAPSPAPACTPPTTCRRSRSRSSSPTATTTSWSPASTPRTWRRGCPTPGCGSTPTRATAACSSTTRSSCRRSSTSWARSNGRAGLPHHRRLRSTARRADPVAPRPRPHHQQRRHRVARCNGELRQQRNPCSYAEPRAGRGRARCRVGVVRGGRGCLRRAATSRRSTALGGSAWTARSCESGSTQSRNAITGTAGSRTLRVPNHSTARSP